MSCSVRNVNPKILTTMDQTTLFSSVALHWQVLKFFHVFFNGHTILSQVSTPSENVSTVSPGSHPQSGYILMTPYSERQIFSLQFIFLLHIRLIGDCEIVQFSRVALLCFSVVCVTFLLHGGILDSSCITLVSIASGQSSNMVGL